MILLNDIDQTNDETLTLRLALNSYDTDLFFYLFTNSQWDSMYS